MQTSRPSREQPMNQALVLSFVVPVLPHTGKSCRAARAVPPGSVTPDIASTTWLGDRRRQRPRTGSGLRGLLAEQPSVDVAHLEQVARGHVDAAVEQRAVRAGHRRGLARAVVPRPKDTASVAKAVLVATTPRRA
jgi:hypothetical protein